MPPLPAQLTNNFTFHILFVLTDRSVSFSRSRLFSHFSRYESFQLRRLLLHAAQTRQSKVKKKAEACTSANIHWIASVGSENDRATGVEADGVCGPTSLTRRE